MRHLVSSSAVLVCCLSASASQNNESGYILSHPNGLSKFKNNLLDDQEIDGIVKYFCIHPEYLMDFLTNSTTTFYPCAMT